MSIIKRVSSSSAIYTLTSVLQRGTAFLLLPLYSRVFSPEEFGILSYVTVFNGFLAILFTLALPAAMTRYYFEYQQEPERLRRFWGSILVFIAGVSVLVGGLLLIVGQQILGPILGDIPFWPYVALGITATIFQPIGLIGLVALQTQEKILKYTVLSLLQFLLTISLTLWLVLSWDSGVEGPLAAIIIAAVFLFVASLVILRHDYVICFDWAELRIAFKYSLPLVPHSVAGQAQPLIDRLILIVFVGASAVGRYQVAYLLGGLVSIVANSVNRAFIPVALSARKNRNENGLKDLCEVGSMMTVLFCLLASGLSLLAPELVTLVATDAYISSAVVVPPMAFGFAAGGIYFILVNILFYEVSATKWVVVGTASATLVNAALNLYLIPRFGIVGAGWAFLIAQSLSAILIGVIGLRFDPVRWRYKAMALSLLLCLIGSVGLSEIVGSLDYVLRLPIKVLGLVAIYVGLNLLHWRRPNHLMTLVGGTISTGVLGRILGVSGTKRQR